MIITNPTRAFTLNAASLAENPFIAWDNLANSASLSGTPTRPGGDRFNATTGTTSDFYLPFVDIVGAAQFDVDFGTAEILTIIAIAAHNLSDLGGAVFVRTSDDGVNYNTITPTHAPADGSTVVFRINPVSSRYWRVVFNGMSQSDPLAVGVIFLGKEIIIPQRVYQGFSPVLSANQVDLASNVSVGGNLMGSSVVSSGAKMDITFQHIPPAFIREHVKPFIDHFNHGGGFFIAWRPHKYFEDVYYAWRDGGVIQPTNSGPRDYMSFSLSARLHYDW